MGNVYTFIWGIRQGFKTNSALYPEKARLEGSDITVYESVVTHFNEVKDSIFRQCRKDLYFISRAGNYQLYSLVISDHMDVVGRTSYLVFSLCIPNGQQIQGGGIGVLQLIKQLYKNKNSDYRIDRNMFTIQQVEEITSTLQTVPRKHGYKNASNAVFFFNDESQLNNEFLDYSGNEIYFIPENSNNEIVQQLKSSGFRIQHLKEIGIANERIAQQLKEFRQLLSEQKDTEISKAQMLHNAISTYLLPDENTKFKQWISKVHREGLVAKNISEFKIELEKMKGSNFLYDPSKASALLSETPEIIDNISEEQRSFFEKYKPAHAAKKSQDKKSQLLDLILSAERNHWTLDPAELEKFFPYAELLNKDQQNKVSIWKREFNTANFERYFKQVQRLAHEIKKTSKKNLLKEKESFKNKVSDLEFKVKNLPDGNKKSNLLAQQDYLFLTSRKWLPKERKVNLALLSLIGVILIGSIVGVVAYNLTPSKHKNIDSDKDGVIDVIDKEKNTQWLTSNNKLKLKDFVDREGKIDILKTEELCDCFKFPDQKDRDILHCKNNEKYFFNTEDRTLYFFNKDESKFYKKDGNDSIALNTSADDKVAKFYEDNILSQQLHEPVKVEIKKETEPKLIVIKNKGKSYQLKAGFTTKEGLKFKNDTKWRFYQGKWEKSDNNGSSWKAVQEKDITFLLSQEATEIKKAAAKQEETAEEQKKKAYAAQVQQIKKQGYKEGTPPAGQTVVTKTLTNPQGQTVNFWKLKVEPGGDTWWDQFLEKDGNVDIDKVCRKIDEIKKKENDPKRIKKVAAVARTLPCYQDPPK